MKNFSDWLPAKTMYTCPVCGQDDTRSLGVHHDSWKQHRESFYCMTCGMSWVARVTDDGVTIGYALSDYDEAQAKRSKSED